MRGYKKKIIVVLTTVILAATMVLSGSQTIASAGMASQPSFTVEVTDVNPREAFVGEDVTVSGVLKPQPFEAEVPEKEIVLVLDTSASMNEDVEVPSSEICTGNVERYCVNHHSSDCVDCDLAYVRTYRDWWQYYDEYYCSSHNKYVSVRNGSAKPDVCSERYRHDWRYDYCPEHNVEGEHYISSTPSTKIAELKKAAKAFIAKMNDVKNLKISIVSFSSLATINPYSTNGNKTVQSLDSRWGHEVPRYTSLGNGFLDAKDSRLNTIIDNLVALGGTNTGEGLRKADYILTNGNKNANKTIVLMSDGLPTFYSCDYYKNYYTGINSSDTPYFAGPGDSVTSKTKGYSDLMGAEVKKNVNNVFSIGYGLGDKESDDNKILREIHNSMGGKSENFYASSDGAIDGIFSDIADEIKALYPINDVKLDIEVNSPTIELPGGSVIDMGTVSYRTDGEVTNGKVIYRAEDIPFSFIVKGNKPGDYTFTGEIGVKFPWGDEILSSSSKFDVGIVKFKDNDLPDIEAKLVNPATDTKEIGEETQITYNIIPNSFEYKDDYSKLLSKDVVFVVDTSAAMNNKYDGLKHFWSGLLNKYTSSDTSKFALVTFDNQGSLVQGLSKASVIKKLTDSITITNSSTRNIESGLKVARDELKTNGISDSEKYIIMITAGNLSYQSSEIDKIKAEGYNYIGVKLGDEENGQATDSLKYLQKYMGGSEDSYYSSINYNEGEINDIAKRIYEILSTKSYRPYIFSDVVLRFNIGDQFEVVSGLTKVEGHSDYNYELKIDPIEYKGNVVDGNVNYTGKESQVSFIIKPKDYGELKFKDYNTISYTNLLEERIISRGIITPVINVESLEMSHGVYMGYDNNSKAYNIDESGLEFAKGSTVTFGARIDTGSDSTEMTLDINPAMTLEKDSSGRKVMPKVYEIMEDGSLSQIGTMVNSLDTYKYTIDKDGEAAAHKRSVLVLYSVVLPESSGEFKNVIKVRDTEKDAVVKVSGDKDKALPNLF